MQMTARRKLGIYALHLVMGLGLCALLTVAWFFVFGAPPGTWGKALILFCTVWLGLVRPIGIINPYSPPSGVE